MACRDDNVLLALGNMTRWRVLWAPDEVSWRMCQATCDAWVRTIASALLPTLAVLPNMQSMQALRALSCTATALPLALRSPILENALSQLVHPPSFAVVLHVLLHPLEGHIAWLDAGMSSSLARATQVLLLRIAGHAGVRVAVGAGVLLQGIGKAAGAGLLPTAGGVRWAIGRWDKAWKMWRGDWVYVKMLR